MTVKITVTKKQNNFFLSQTEITSHPIMLWGKIFNLGDRNEITISNSTAKNVIEYIAAK